MAHIEVGFTEELGCFELIGLFEVHTVHGTGIRWCEVTCRLSAYPACGHVRNLCGRKEVVHLLVDGSRDALIVDADALGGLLDLSEDVILQPFQCLFVTGRASDDVTTRCYHLLHTILAVVGLQLRQFLECHCHAYLIASCRTNQTVYLMEIERWQLVDDDAHWHILSLPAIDTRSQTVQDQGIQRANHLLLLRVIGDNQIGRMLRVADLQIKVITRKHPIGFLRYKTCSVHTECSHHTFQLIHRIVIIR